MAPRTAKAKKAADAKVADNEAPKQGRNKGKNIEEPVVDTKDETEEMASVTDKKAKRGKRKAAIELVDKVEETAPPSKKGKKEKAEEPVGDVNDPLEEESASSDGNDQNGDQLSTNGDTDDAPLVSTGRARKQPKKETAIEKPEARSGRGRKNTKPEKVIQVEDDEVTDEKPAPKRGRGRKVQPKVDEAESDDKSDKAEEEVKPDPPTKGRKRAVKPAAKENTPDIEESVDEEPKKKEVKGRKTKGKKAKEEVKEDEEEEAAKKEEGEGDIKSEDIEDTQDTDTKPVKGKRGGKKRAVETPVLDEEPQDTGEIKKKKRAPSEDVKTAAPKNKSTTDYESLNFSNASKNAQDKEWNFKIASWNVDGIRAWLSKGGLDFIKHEKPDILCLQETKCSKEKLPDEIANLPGYHAYWLCSDKDGYAGVGIYTTKLAMNVQYGLQNEELDSEGRIITAEYEHFYLICTYVPNAGRNLVTLPKRLQWNNEFRKYVNELDKKKPVIICGDMNVAHNEIDLANPKTNKKNAGFTVEERSGMTDLLGDGFVDTYRHQHPDQAGAYTFWTYMKNSRAKNVGWRLDYFIVSQRLLPSLCDSIIRDGVYGSDHCPISLFLHLSSAEKPK